MKFIKIILGIILALVVLVLLAGLFLPKELNIEREIVINQPESKVFHYIRSLQNQNKFNVWARKDPNIKNSFSGVEGQVGSTSHWEGNDDVGVGEQEIKALKENERIDFELRFKKPFEATNSGFMTTDSLAATQTKVVWGFNSHSDYPMNVVSYFMKNMLNEQLLEGLKNLKVIMEK